MKNSVVFVHLLNDYSGSPKILRHAISAALRLGGQMKLYVGHSGTGFLSNCGVPTTHYWYRRTGFKIGTIFTYLLSQLILFVRLLFDRSIDKDAVIYVNTLLPFGAALFGMVSGKKVVYHVHEISITPLPLKLFLTLVSRMTSDLNLYVSDAHMRALPIAGVHSQRIYNALDEAFLSVAAQHNYSPRVNGKFRVLMIASLREYKGIVELLVLANDLLDHADIHLDLVLNDDKAAINSWLHKRLVPSNLVCHPRTADTAAFYRQASVVLNLSRVDQCVETFGMTILEALAFGIPVIVPPVGGPSELICHGVEGFLVDSRDRIAVRNAVLELYGGSGLCLQMSGASKRRALDFSPQTFAAKIVDTIITARRT